jgi:hypothetical protein
VGNTPKAPTGWSRHASPRAVSQNDRRLMLIGRDDPSKAETLTVAAVESGVPSLVEARQVIDGFHVMIRRHCAGG